MLLLPHDAQSILAATMCLQCDNSDPVLMGVACFQMEFDPSLDVDVNHAPRDWRDADLWVSAAEFLDSMKPHLDKYLAAQGEPPVEEMEWQVGEDDDLWSGPHTCDTICSASMASAASCSPSCCQLGCA